MLHPQRCTDERPHDPADFERLLTEAFGPVADWFPAQLPGIGPILLPLPEPPK